MMKGSHTPFLFHGKRRKKWQERWGRIKKKKPQLKTTDCGLGGKSQDSSDSSKYFRDQYQPHTSNESATHPRLATPHTYYGIFMLSFIFIKCVSSLVTMKPRVIGYWFDLYSYKVGWTYLLFRHDTLFTVTLTNKLTDTYRTKALI